ncbi:MAG: hypothetical protein JWN35_206 [Frankiales bacterium]|jgi:hypothetical protein|nr:hypothetical protein [Frankiales bacterium]
MPAPLFHVVGEVEQHVAEAGWDQPPQLFALVDTEELLRAEPQLAGTMGLVAAVPGGLTPIAQEPLAEGPLDEALAGIVFGTEVLGVVLVHEVVVLPPAAEAAVGEADPVEYAATHPDRREVRMVVGVLRDGSREAVLRLRAGSDGEDDRLSGPDLAPALADALLATLD